MGSWFSNFHIRGGEKVTQETLARCFADMLSQQGFVPASEKEADGGIAMIGGDSPWVSVYSDLLDLEDPEKLAAVAKFVSGVFHSDVLGIGCFDSDYLYLNLINAEEKIDAWANVGSSDEMGICRSTDLVKWGPRVGDMQAFEKILEEEYVFAEEALMPLQDILGLDSEQAAASYEYLEDMGLAEQAQYLYFRQKGEPSEELPRLVPHTYNMMPCRLGVPSVTNAINKGGASKGLKIFFLGSYVEKEEITFPDVTLYANSVHRPIQLRKVQLVDGSWAYYHHDPDFQIPAGISETLPDMKRFRMEMDASFGVRFVPQGDAGKLHEITVVLVPDKNPEGATGWNYIPQKKC